MITREEYGLLKEYRRLGYKWIARDKNGRLFVYQEMPRRYRKTWNFGGVVVNIRGEYFTFIKWEDKEPTRITDLINEYESHQLLKQEPENAVIPEGYEVLSDEWLAEHSEFADGIGECYIYETVGNMEKLLIPKHEKVVIPSFVAEWIDECKEGKLFFSNLNLLEEKAEVKNWIYEHDNGDDTTMKREEMVIKAYYDDYVVEKEKLYTVKLANGDCLYKFKDIEVGWTNGYLYYKNDPDYQLTQSEIESVDPRLIQFAVEVE